MEKSLLSILVDTQRGGEQSILATLKFAILPIAKVFTMCFLGCLMASKWYIPVNILMVTISGSLIGFIVACIVRPPYPYFKFTIIHIATGNIGNIPLVLIASLCRDESNPFGDSDKCSQDGNAYIAFGQWVGAVVLYTYVFQMLAPPLEETFDNLEEEKLPISTPVNAVNNGVPEQVPLLTPQKPEAIIMLESSKRGKIISQLHYVVEKLKLKQIFRPPIAASILAIVIGTIPVLKQFIFADDAPFFFLTDSCLILGEAMIPCILLALGGNLIDGPGAGTAKLGFRTVTAIVFARLILVPPAGLGIVTLAEKLGFFPKGDKMFKFVLLLQHSMPTSVLAGAVANLRGWGKESAAVLFWVHIFAVFSISGWTLLYLRLLF